MDSSKKIITRHEFECPIFGHPRDFLQSKLPTHECVLRCIFEERFKLAIETNNKKVSFSKVARTVAEKVKCLYDKASIPTVSVYRIYQLVNAYHDSYYKIRKSYNRDKDKTSFKQKIEEFKLRSSSLFDVAACKCAIYVDCTCKKTPNACECAISINCTCDKAKKIPSLELRFIFLQRKCGLGRIGSVDIKVTKKLNQRIKRKIREHQRVQSELNISNSKAEEHREDSLFSDHYSPDSDDEYKPSTSSANLHSQMRVKMCATALNSDRFGLSDRATAAIASSVLQDIGIVTDTDSSYVVDKCKIRREKSRVRKDLNFIPNEEICGLYFDGRKDQTLFVEKINGKNFRRSRKEDHYSLIQEPGSIYIGHVSPSSSTAAFITKSICSYLSGLQISLEKLRVIGCDGTVTNTGWKNGVMRQLELHVGRPLQWSVCLLHFNELPFRHIFQHIDGATTGPKSFSGSIGKQLVGCEKLPVVEYESVDCSIPEIDKKMLSKDQQYLLDISKAIKSGHCPEDLSIREPGPLSNSRWLTTANRVLRLYISLINPSESLKQIVVFILKSYMPVWFNIKQSKYFTEGPKHVFLAIKTSRYLSDDLLQVINPVIERNAFFAHPENVLLAMIADDRKPIRELGYRRIVKARQSASKGKTIRNFVPPKINFKATDYTEIIDWNKCTLYPPQCYRT